MPTSDVLPLAPLPLSAAQADALRQRRLKKHDVAMVLLHWFNAAVWGIELATGAALISATAFAIAPAWYIRSVSAIFGSRADLLRVHIAIGLAWIAVSLVYAVFGARTYLARDVLQRETRLDHDDWRWLIVKALRIAGRTDEALPPQGIYNAGQKLFAIVVYVLVPVVMVSGLIMTWRLFGPTVIGWAIVLHFAAVGAVAAGLMIHVYMGAVFPEEKPAFFSMITGSVDELFAYRHHYKWWREIDEHRAARAARGVAESDVP